ncbi:MAG: hypothetical protein KAR32_06105, partial [Candidatus Omnitrophica bacterium]|nr:hypothetical protein [Candidatus Omnitrophota bacterium]
VKEHLPVSAFKEYFVEPAIEMFVQIGTLNGTMAGLVQPGGFAAGYTADEAFVANLLGVFKLADEMASMNGWTVTNTLKLTKYNDLVDESTEKIINNLSNPPPPKTIEALYASFDAEASKESKAEEAKRNAELKKYGNLVDTMDPFKNIFYYGIDSLNSQLGSYLVSPDNSPFLRGSEYIFSSLGAGSYLKAAGLNERYLTKDELNMEVEVDPETGEIKLMRGKYYWVAMRGREPHSGEGGEDVKLGRLLGYGRRGDFYFKGEYSTKFDYSGLTAKEKKELGIDLNKGSIIHTNKDGKKVVLEIGEDGMSIKDGLINNDSILVLGRVFASNDGAETTVNFGTFTVGEGDQQQKVEFSAAFDQEVTEKGTTLDTVVLTQTKKKTVPNVAKGREALEEA